MFDDIINNNNVVKVKKDKLDVLLDFLQEEFCVDEFYPGCGQCNDEVEPVDDKMACRKCWTDILTQ